MKFQVPDIITDEFILSICFNSLGFIDANKTSKVFLKKNPRVRFYLQHRFQDSDPNNILEILYRIKHKIEVHPVCPICGAPTKLKNTTEGFRKVCSNRCTMKKCHSPEVKAKSSEEWKRKWGKENPEGNTIRRQKERETNLKKFGTEVAINNPEIKDKRKRTNEERWGSENVFGNLEVQEKIKETFNERYGVDWFIKSEEFKRKRIESSIEHYGTEYPIMSEEVKNKVFNTKRKNGTFSTSSIEEKFYDFLLTIFKEDVIKRNWNKDPRYPWHCDFYIESLDLFIEIQGLWTHGDHPFDCTNEKDLNILETWKEKSLTRKFYRSAIKIWSEVDVLKRETAKKNHLNFLEVFSNDIEEAKSIFLKHRTREV